MKLQMLPLAALVFCTSAAAARAPESAPPAGEGPNIWVGLGGGGYTGQNYPNDSGSQEDRDHNKVGGYAAHFSLNFEGRSAEFRIRHSWLFHFTSNTANELAAEVGIPLSPDRKFWASAGVSRLTDVSNSRKAPTVGAPLELRFYPARGLEFMVHGNFNKDDNFIGVAVAGAIGRHRPL